MTAAEVKARGGQRNASDRCFLLASADPDVLR